MAGVAQFLQRSDLVEAKALLRQMTERITVAEMFIQRLKRVSFMMPWGVTLQEEQEIKSMRKSCDDLIDTAPPWLKLVFCSFSETPVERHPLFSETIQEIPNVVFEGLLFNRKRTFIGVVRRLIRRLPNNAYEIDYETTDEPYASLRSASTPRTNLNPHRKFAHWLDEMIDNNW